MNKNKTEVGAAEDGRGNAISQQGTSNLKQENLQIPGWKSVKVSM